MIFPLRLLNLYRACAADSVRYALTGVLFERDAKGQCRAVATDSKMLVVVEFAEPADPPAVAAALAVDHTATPGVARVVPATALKSLVLTWKKAGRAKVAGQHAGWAALSEGGDGPAFRLAAELGCGRMAVEDRPVEGRFPPYKEVLAKTDGEPAKSATFDPALVATLAGVLNDVLGNEDCDGQAATFTFCPKGKLLVAGESADKRTKATGLLMNLA
jgi:hypothetical protein